MRDAADDYFVGPITLVTKTGVWIKWEDVESKHDLAIDNYYDEWFFVDEKPASPEPTA